MKPKLMGKKLGMTQIFDKDGNAIACTVIHAEPNVVTQIKTTESDGYNAIQMGYAKVTAKDPRRKESRTSKPLRGHFAKGNVEPRRYLSEFVVDKVEGYTLGQEIGVTLFAAGAPIDIVATSKGKGFQGVMKRHNFAGGPGAHGASLIHRVPGSQGMRTSPGRVWPGHKGAGHMGNARVTVQNSEVVLVDEKENLILVKGGVPGPIGGMVTLSFAEKKAQKAEKAHKKTGKDKK